MTPEKQKKQLKYLADLNDRLSALRLSIPDKHIKRSSGDSLRQFLERETASSKAALAKAKG